MNAVERDLQFECAALLYREAELLDDGRIDEWLKLLAPDMTYEVLSAGGERGGSCYAQETAGTLGMRVRRLDTKNAWAEEPRSRTLRIVSNVRVVAPGDAREMVVRSNVLVYRTKDDEPSGVLLAGDRRDRLRRTDAGLLLAARSVRLLDRVLRMPNLAIVL